MTREEREIIEAIKSMGYDRTAYPREKVSAVVIMAIEALSAEAVRGEWTRKTKEYNDCDGHRFVYWHECDQCGSRPPRNEFTKKVWWSNFCPNCGADMRGEKERMKIISFQFYKCPARCKVLYEKDNGKTVGAFVYGNAVCNTCPEVALKQFAEMCKRGGE